MQFDRWHIDCKLKGFKMRFLTSKDWILNNWWCRIPEKCTRLSKDCPRGWYKMKFYRKRCQKRQTQWTLVTQSNHYLHIKIDIKIKKLTSLSPLKIGLSAKVASPLQKLLQRRTGWT